jgi:hypothetical protein
VPGTRLELVTRGFSVLSHKQAKILLYKDFNLVIFLTPLFYVNFMPELTQELAVRV